MLLDVLTQRFADYALQTYEMPLTQVDGVHLALARSIPTPAEFRTVRDYEAYAARLRRMPRDFADAVAVLRQGLRERARQRLGPRFDVRAFHHAVLAGGPLPLRLLDTAVDRWVARQLQTAAAAK